MAGKGLLFGGTVLVDIVKRINTYPTKGKLGVIREMTRGVGGLACNNPINIRVLDPSVEVATMGKVGEDELGTYVIEKLSSYGVDVTAVARAPGLPTSFTDVMCDTSDGSRTFFHSYGACAEWGPGDIPWEKAAEKYGYVQLGYALLLSAMDAPDEKDGTVMAGALRRFSELGLRTSMDVVSDEGDRFRSVVGPSLLYVDDLMVNEVEASAITGEKVREDDGKLVPSGLAAAAHGLIRAGVRRNVVIHAPEGAVGVDRDGELFLQPSHEIATGEIAGSVGAGDAFASGVVYGLSRGWDLADALELGTGMAGLNLFDPTTTGGAKPLMKVKEFMRSRGYREGVFDGV
ncbi:MAG: carbohydrate kinase family protein [Planctomycetes bacterium]|nr:carbohydrate kinase family protein [Planctomycetota bacterium]